MEELWLPPPRLIPPPPPRLPPPPRCASAGVKLRAKPTIVITIKFLVFISLLLSYLFSLSTVSAAKIERNSEEISPELKYFSQFA
jgi:hypothetical protein